MIPQPQSDAEQAFHKGINSFLSGPALDSDLAPNLPTIADVLKPSARPPAAQKNFTLGLQALHRGQGTTAASWRFSGSTASDAIAGECLHDTTGKWRLTNMAYGSAVWQLIDASNSLSQLAGIPSLENFELRFLKIPGIPIEAFWLMSSTGGTDLAVVFPAPPDQLQRRLKAQAVYEMPVFLDTVERNVDYAIGIGDGGTLCRRRGSGWLRTPATRSPALPAFT
jgi:hypothetical protein